MRSALTIIFFISLSFNTLFSQEIVQWRGPDRNGIFPEKNLLKEWPENGPEILWRFDELGLGYSSAAVTANMVLITGTVDSISYIFSFDHDGKLQWKKEYGQEFKNQFPGARATPLIFEGRGYVLTSLGLLHCFNIDNGDFFWSKNLFKDLKGKNNMYGITENLLMDGNILYCTPGGPDDNVVALNRITGEVLWKSKGKGEVSAYCSPLLIERGGKKFFINMTAKSVIAINTENGELAWSYDLFNKQFVHANTPIYRDGFLFVMDGFEAGSIMLKISEDGNSVKEVWKTKLLDETNGNAVLIGNNLYCPAESKKKICCVDWETGVIKYAARMFSPGTVISADGLLYCYTYDGDLGIVEPTENGFVEISSIKYPKLTELHIAHPVIKDGRLYVRFKNTLLVYSISK
ncbi:PQQ-binding-like beta-propeller repeat protein [Bacteroidota bacterium]